MQFRDLTIEDKALFDTFLSLENPTYANCFDSEFEFSSLFCWKDDYSLKISVDEIALYLSATFAGKQFYFAPIVKERKDLSLAFSRLEEHAKEKGEELILAGVGEIKKKALEEVVKKDYRFFPDRNNYEYLYLSKDLISLEHPSLSYKRQMKHAFEKRFDFRFRKIEPSDIEEILGLVQTWKNERHADSSDYQAIFNAMKYYEKLNLVGAVIEIKGKIRAFSIGAYGRCGVGIVLFEKAEGKFIGLYPTMMNLFASEFFRGVKYINRQEDMGLSGLRDSKLSYHPCGFAPKYTLMRALVYER